MIASPGGVQALDNSHDRARLMPAAFQLTERTGHPSFLDLPWETPLEEWTSPRIVNLIRGISRHVVRFVEYDGALYALKELPERPARREWTLLRRLEGQGLPVVEAVGHRDRREASDLDAILITRHLEYSLPYRALFAGAAIPDLRDASAERARGAARPPAPRAGSSGATARSRTRSSAATPARSRPTSSTPRPASCTARCPTGSARYDLDIAQMNIVGELLDVDAEVGLPPDLDPDETGAEIVARYTALWDELTREEVFGARRALPGRRAAAPAERARLRRRGDPAGRDARAATGCGSIRMSSSRATTVTACCG